MILYCSWSIRSFVGLMEQTGSCKTFVYPSPPVSCSQHRCTTTLSQLISSMSKQNATGQTFLHRPICLAKTLAIAVLQYHATPWLSMSWRSDSVYFFGPESMQLLQAWEWTASPHLSVKVRGQTGQPPNTYTDPLPKFARNSLLFSLAVVFLGFGYSSALASL